MQSKNLFDLLRTKTIIAILDGDTSFGEYEIEEEKRIRIALPYLSGPKLCELSSYFGYPQVYAQLSRWQYMESVSSAMTFVF